MTNSIKRWSIEKDIKDLNIALLNNTVSITSTDTVLGLLAPITEAGFFNLNSIKGEREKKPYLILIASPKKLEVFTQIEKLTPAMLNIINNCWPGPLTIVFQASSLIPFYLKSPQGTIALRCPQHQGLLKLLGHFDGLFSTSANKSGNPAPQTYKDISSKLIKKIECIVLDDIEKPEKNQPSTIIDFSEAMSNPSAQICVTREGAYPIKDLEHCYGSPFKK